MNSAILTRKPYDNTQSLDLPPTPSSYNEKINNGLSNPRYGSIGSSSRIEDMQTTVTSNDDEGLYLLWTHQLLRERGFAPSPCWLNEEDYANDTHINNIDDDDDSSVSGDEEDPYEKKRRLFSPTVSSGHNEHLYSYQSSLMSQNSIPSYISQRNQEEQEGHAFRGIFSACFGKCS